MCCSAPQHARNTFAHPPRLQVTSQNQGTPPPTMPFKATITLGSKRAADAATLLPASPVEPVPTEHAGPEGQDDWNQAAA